MTGMNEPRRGPAGEAQAAEEIHRNQGIKSRNLDTITPPQSERVRLLVETLRDPMQHGHTFEYELAFNPPVMQAALDAGFDLGWEPEDIVAALLQVRAEGRP
jgi:hypothetical protein